MPRTLLRRGLESAGIFMPIGGNAQPRDLKSAANGRLSLEAPLATGIGLGSEIVKSHDSSRQARRSPCAFSARIGIRQGSRGTPLAIGTRQDRMAFQFPLTAPAVWSRRRVPKVRRTTLTCPAVRFTLPVVQPKRAAGNSQGSAAVRSSGSRDSLGRRQVDSVANLTRSQRLDRGIGRHTYGLDGDNRAARAQLSDLVVSEMVRVREHPPRR
jgi:hypothetical protein